MLKFSLSSFLIGSRHDDGKLPRWSSQELALGKSSLQYSTWIEYLKFHNSTKSLALLFYFLVISKQYKAFMLSGSFPVSTLDHKGEQT